MYAVLICHHCKKSIRVPFGKTTEFSLVKCPSCGVKIARTDNERLYAYTENLLNRLTDVSLKSICTDPIENSTTISETDGSFYDNIENLEQLFEGSDWEIKTELASVLDTLWLMVRSDVRDADLVALKDTRKKIHDLFLNRVDPKNRETEKILFPKEGSKDV